MSDTILWKPCPYCGDTTMRYDAALKRESCDCCGHLITSLTLKTDPIVCGQRADHGLVCQNSYGHRAKGGRNNDGHYYVVMP